MYTWTHSTLIFSYAIPTNIINYNRIFVEYFDSQAIEKSISVVNGHKFGRNVFLATFFPDEKFEVGDYGG